MTKTSTMAETFDVQTRRAIKMALARDAYERNLVTIVDPDLTGFDWLVATHRDLFAVSEQGHKLIMHGWFFGIHRHGDAIYLFQNCALRDRSALLGRVIRFQLVDRTLRNPQILVTGLHANCHQIAIIDGLLCVVDTANQAILRFTLDGTPVDVKTPFPVAPNTDTSGGYLHMNSIAKIHGKIAVILHNGTILPERKSELVWLNRNWQVESRQELDGHKCHDIVEDRGAIWHSASMEGEIICSDGRRAKISDELMTRGIAFSDDRIIVGVSAFGPRQKRDSLGGGIVILDRTLNKRAEMELTGPPADIIAL